MTDVLMTQRRDKLFSILEICTIVLFAVVSLFMAFPYRVNIFLSWEGAYRLSSGQIPFKDFGLPMGYMYWVVPAIFFKIFGAQMITLIKAQTFINIISGLAFRSILKNLSIQPGLRLVCVFLYCLSFSFFNFWPWYNHTVIVYELVGLAFLMKYFFSGNKRIHLFLSAFFIFISFFTKQDAGALGFLICVALLTYHSVRKKKWSAIVIFLVSAALVGLTFILPLLRYNFFYWFNYGQPPHTSRMSVFEVLDEFLYSSQWIKFYLLLTILVILAKYKTVSAWFFDERNVVFSLLTLGILAEAAVLQVTSYTPPDNNIFFHSFAFAFLFSAFLDYFKLDLYKLRNLLVLSLLITVWWSGVFWKYIQGPVKSVFAGKQLDTNENIVNRHNYILAPAAGEIPMSEWIFSDLSSFTKIRLPKATVEGIDRLLNSKVAEGRQSLHVLNMTELTPLAVEMPYEVETGGEIPLWYHLGVSMFNKQLKTYQGKLISHYYDLVLFENIPNLNNFYPFAIRNTLLECYHKVDSFPAPRKGNTQGTIEVFVK